ncbi:MAG: DUF5082 family protein [Ruminococcus sp.]|nr:DUF5082 family protein [Ruminococcus sp.]
MSELDNLYNQQSSYRAQKAQREAERAAVKKKIERLEAAKAKVTLAKTDAETAKDYIANKLETHADSWTGSVYNAVDDIHKSGVNPKFNAYYEDVDYVLDAICDEITKLENENRNLGYILNSIVNALNDIGNEIEKWLN